MAGKPIQRLRVQSIRQPSSVVKVDPPLIQSPIAASLSQDSSVAEPLARDGEEVTIAPPEDSPSEPTIALEESPLSPQPKLSSRLWRGVRLLGAPLAWLILIGLCSGTGLAAFWWLTTLPPVPDCKTASPFAGDSDRLFCAEQAARSGDPDALVRGLELVRTWGPDHPLAPQAKRLTLEWSRSLLNVARNRAEQDKFNEAIALAQKLPASNPLYKEAQATIAAWKQNQGQEKTFNNAISAALKAQDWAEVDVQLQTIAKLKGEYWQQYASRQRQRAIVERTARRQLEQVRALTESAAGNGEILAKAIALAQQINPSTYAAQEVKAELNRLSQTIATLVNTRVAQGDVPGAIGLAQLLPPDAAVPPEVQSVLWVGRAQPLAANTLSFQPLPEQIWQFWMVLPGVQQIPGDSPVAGPAQELAARLQPKLEDLNQLQMASALARLGHISTLQLAIALAQGITPDRPQRLYAQSLIADWRKAIEQAEDRPYLSAAQDLAKKGDIKQLKAAIALASRIPLGRALRPEAQNAIFDWQQQIQVIEDKPFLDQARALAKQNKLKEAVQATGKVPLGRALTKEAQELAQTWTAQIQTAEDRPILTQATALADQGNLGAAINLAAQIGPDRALSGEAQTAIDRWQAQLAKWEAQQAASRRSKRASPTDDSDPPSPARSRSPKPN